jgi:hypothetical protein
MMKKLLLTSIAALLLATGAAHAVPDQCVVALSKDHLRVKPNMRSKSVENIDPVEQGRIMILDQDNTVQLFKGWTHIQDIDAKTAFVGYRNYLISGWIRTKNIKKAECP